MFTYFTYVDLSWFRNCSGGGGEGMARLLLPPPPSGYAPDVSSRVNFRKFAISPHAFVTASLSLYPFYDLSKMTGKMWIIPHRFFFCIKLSLLSAMMKLFILHFNASIHIFSAMNTFRPSRYLTRDWHPLNFKPQYQKILLLF